MKILTSTNTLDLSGVPTFTLTMYNELTKQGHDVTVYSPLGGKLAKDIKTISNISDINLPDLILAQHNNLAQDLKQKFPKIPLIFYSHGLLPDLEQPPNFLADWYFVINEECQENFIKKGVPKEKITIVRDFVNTERFVATKPINKKLSNILFISNYKKWKNFKAVSGASAKLDLNLKCFGSPYGRNYKIEDAINDADLVISWGRGILEGMSCGRAVLSFDRFEGDGYLTTETYLESRKNNFSGRIYHKNFDAESLLTEIQKYNSDDGQVNRDLILKYHNVTTGVEQIMDTFKMLQTIC